MCLEVCHACSRKHYRAVVFIAPCAFHMKPEDFEKRHPIIFKRLTKERMADILEKRKTNTNNY